MFEQFIAHKSVITLIHSFHVNPTALQRRTSLHLAIMIKMTLFDKIAHIVAHFVIGLSISVMSMIDWINQAISLVDVRNYYNNKNIPFLWWTVAVQCINVEIIRIWAKIITFWYRNCWRVNCALRAISSICMGPKRPLLLDGNHLGICHPDICHGLLLNIVTTSYQTFCTSLQELLQ